MSCLLVSFKRSNRLEATQQNIIGKESELSGPAFMKISCFKIATDLTCKLRCVGYFAAGTIFPSGLVVLRLCSYAVNKKNALTLLDVCSV